MLQRFDAQIPPDLRAEIVLSGRGLHALLTIASIVEREAVIAEERSVIASVFWNRLDADLPLEADPTVQYALAQEPANVAVFGHWKSPLTADDLRIPSPWNTYVVGALPPHADRLARPRIHPRRAAPRPNQLLLLRRPRRRRPPLRRDLRGAQR